MRTDPDVPRAAERDGFRVDTFGTILSRSIMLRDLRSLLSECPLDSTFDCYRAAIVEGNLLGKPTASARRIGFNRLKEFYALDPRIAVFRALRDLWAADEAAQPLLALLCATARDPILRAMTPFVLNVPAGSLVSAPMASEEGSRQFPDKFSSATSLVLGKNAVSSWAQAGLLEGSRDRRRARANSRPPSVAYALLLGDLCGRRGISLFSTIWTAMLDAPAHVLREQALAAARQGWIEYRAAGDVAEVGFRYLMRDRSEVSR